MIGIAYRAGYRYQLVAPYFCETGICSPHAVEDNYIALGFDGGLRIREGYSWDGPSGPTIDTANFMRGSLVHDALYQLMCEGLLPDTFRDQADRLLQKLCIEDGMSALRAWWVYQGVKWGGGPHARREAEKPIRHAP